jgi:hypothetical protein
MKLMVLSPMYWIDEATTRRVTWLYLASCKRAGVDESIRRAYGIGSTYYPGETEMMIGGLARFLAESAEDFTHVLFTHAWDQLFIQPLEEIIWRYNELGSPPFFHAAAVQRANVHTNEYDQFFDELALYRFPGAGFIAEIPLVVELFSRMDIRHTHDASWAYFNAWREGWFRPMLDTECTIFQTMEIRSDKDNRSPDCIIKEGKLYNTYTETYPCIAHFGGYIYVDPEHGKDRIIEPWARALGVIE